MNQELKYFHPKQTEKQTYWENVEKSVTMSLFFRRNLAVDFVVKIIFFVLNIWSAVVVAFLGVDTKKGYYQS